MGYSTDFEGSFKITPALKDEHKQYLLAFSDTRRMQRNPIRCELMSDPIRLAAGLPVGVEGEYTVFGEGFCGQNSDESILNYNEPARTQPGLWCQWIPTEDGSALEWNGTEKFYSYIDWLQYLTLNFFKPWGYTLSGSVKWSGERMDDAGIITFFGNTLNTFISVKDPKHHKKYIIDLHKE